MYCCSLYRNIVIAFSASHARFVSHRLCLLWRLYLNPLSSRLFSSGVSMMFVLLITLGKNFVLEVVFCFWSAVSFLSFFFTIWYWLSDSIFKLESIEFLIMYQLLPHSLAACRCSLYNLLLSRLFSCISIRFRLLFLSLGSFGVCLEAGEVLGP
jgi:hypothetical protein